MAQPGAVPAVLSNADEFSNPSSKALLALFVLAGASALVILPTNLNIIVTASLCVFAGSWKSVKASPPEDRMSTKDALRFPIIGSAVLFGLFLAFKFLPAKWINTVIAGNFAVLGIFVITATIAPCFIFVLPKHIADRQYKLPKFQIPLIMDKPLDDSISTAEAIAAVFSTAFCLWYFLKKHWLANNILGLAFAIQGIENISLGATVTGCVLLGGLFFYDIFWVFFTPVMVSVAKSFDAPAKLLFPRAGDLVDGKQPFSMLGLGDIVIPGVFVALILRYDVLQKFKTKYFQSTFAGYVAGLGTTIAVMHIFKAAQPALLYIVPTVIGFPAVHSLLQGEFKQLFSFKESSEEPASNGQNQSRAAVSTGSQIGKKQS